MVDTDKGTWNKLFKEFEEEGVSKWHVHSHDFERAEDRDGLKPRFLDVQVVIQEASQLCQLKVESLPG